jgi:hypothetical protein
MILSSKIFFFLRLAREMHMGSDLLTYRFSYGLEHDSSVSLLRCLIKQPANRQATIL